MSSSSKVMLYNVSTEQIHFYDSHCPSPPTGMQGRIINCINSAHKFQLSRERGRYEVRECVYRLSGPQQSRAPSQPFTHRPNKTNCMIGHFCHCINVGQAQYTATNINGLFMLARGQRSEKFSRWDSVWFQKIQLKSVDLSVPLRKSHLAALCSANRGILIRIL